MTEKNKGAKDSPVKSVSVTPAITALLKPTAEYLGIELRDYVKSNIQEWKEKRRERNLNAHLEAVREKLKKEPPSSNQASPSISQLDIFDEWIEKAQDIDPEDTQLSDIWQNLLAKAARGEKVPTEVVAALKSLSPKEARFLVETEQRTHPLSILRGSVSAENRYLAKSLEAKGILEKDYAFSVFFLSSLGVFGVVTYYLAENMKLFQPMSPLVGIVTAVAVVGIGFSMRPGLVHWRRSWLGRELLGFATSGFARHASDDAQPGVLGDAAR